MAWRDAEGVKVAPVPDLTAPAATCPPPSGPALISASGTSPALGGIDVPALIAADGGTGGGGGDGGGGDGGGGGGTGEDLIAPNTTKGKGPKKTISKNKATFEFSSSEPGSSFECKLDKKPAKPCTSPKKVKKLKDGKHKFSATAIDAAGNRDASPAVWKFKVDAD